MNNNFLIRIKNVIVENLPEFKNKKIEDIFYHFKDTKYAALLLSGGNHDCSRFSIIGIEPFLTITAKQTSIKIETKEQKILLQDNPFDILKNILEATTLPQISHIGSHLSWTGTVSCPYNTTLPRISHIGSCPQDFTPLRNNLISNLKSQIYPFLCGGIGYFSYDLKNFIEKLNEKSENDLHLPDLFFTFHSLFLIYDKVKDKYLISAVDFENSNQSIAIKTKNFKEKLLLAASKSFPPKKGKTQKQKTQYTCLTSNLKRRDYIKAVKKIKAYIAAGEIYQANLSQRFSISFEDDSYCLFYKLHKINPAPFSAYLNCGDHKIISSSPERFLFRYGNYVETRPIKGTRPRGKNQQNDKKLLKELLGSEKDKAELLMIVDLLRNDLGKLCEAGTVKVERLRKIEKYTNVFHSLAIISGKLKNNTDSISLIKACFPGGSITGCPKIRAMEIIEEIEPTKRGIYTGAIGYISFYKTMDMNIAIRTIVIKNGKAYFSVGGGIISDSDPEAEFMETIYKGESIVKSILLSNKRVQSGTIWKRLKVS